MNILDEDYFFFSLRRQFSLRPQEIILLRLEAPRDILRCVESMSLLQYSRIRIGIPLTGFINFLSYET